MEKIREEIAKADAQSQKIGNYILDLAKRSGAVIDSKKTLDECMKQIAAKAKKQAINGMAIIDDPVAYGWAAEYFGLTAEKEPNAQTPAPEPQAETKIENLLNYELEDLLP
ncbi:MAG: Cas9 inhibitor AcrIIA9 family protein [Negativibacillus sp.]